MSTKDDKVMRSFDTGATRDTAEGKLDYDGFLNPAVLKQFARYMNMNRLQSDGQLRDSDNWQKGIPMDAYRKSLHRHHMEFWPLARSIEHHDRDGETAIVGVACGMLFNIMGYLTEWLKEHDEVRFDDDEPTPEMRERQAKLNEEPEQKLIEFSTVKAHDDALMAPVIERLREWCQEINEQLEDVPELPICFGCDNECIECKDENDCDTHVCEDCGFTAECGDEEGKSEEPQKDIFLCLSCLSLAKNFEMWPCRDCQVNPHNKGGMNYFSTIDILKGGD